MPGKGKELVFEQLPFNHPLWILYSSGTSGPPKCIVHSAGVRVVDIYILLLDIPQGALLQCLKEGCFSMDMGQDDW